MHGEMTTMADLLLHPFDALLKPFEGQPLTLPKES